MGGDKTSLVASKLKDILLQIEVYINQGNWDQALHLYEELDKNWDKLISEVPKDKLEELYKIISFMATLLKDKYIELKEREKYLQARRAYEKLS